MPTPAERITLDSPAGIPLGLLWAGSGMLLFLWVWIGWFHPLIELDENQTLYIYSSASQVIAGVYGLTLAGYVFLRNEQNRLVDRDETLAEIFDLIQQREHDFVLLLSTISTVAILSSLLAIAVYRQRSDFVHYGSINAATALFLLSISLTTIFIVEALRPGKIVRASDLIKGEVAEAAGAAAGATPSKTPVQLADFLVEYNALERVLDGYATSYIEPALAGESNSKVGPRWPAQKIIAAMEAQGLVPNSLVQEVKAIGRYRNALLHGNDMSVDPWMMARLRAARTTLEQALA
jgi:hypothetical protein